MSVRTYQGHGTRQTPQSDPIPGKGMVPNSAGGYAFAVDDFTRLERFLVLGSEGGTYYVGERKLTKDNAACVARCLQADGKRTVDTIVEVSDAGRAPRNLPAIFALAVAASCEDTETRRYALDALPKVCRIGTHLFQFAEIVQDFRGWGRSLRRAMAEWYLSQDVNRLAYQLVKYRQREGWMHRDLLRKAHPGREVSSGNPRSEVSDDQAALFGWVVGGYPAARDASTVQFENPRPMEAFMEAQAADRPERVVALIERFGSDLPREAIKPEHLSDPAVNAALVDAGMPMTALIRNLANLTRYGVLKPMSSRTREVCERITSPEALRKARVHPLAVLMALKTYATGHGLRGDNTWDPVGEIEDALDTAFYAAFDNVKPTGKRHVLGVDVSSSMGWGQIGGSLLTPAEGAAVMAMVTARVEPYTAVRGFTHQFVDLGITAKDRLESACRKVRHQNFGSTDCALPMIWALESGIEADAFCVYTDNETWVGRTHPIQALQDYRDKTGIQAKLVVVGMTATEVTIADPADAGMLDVVGFDASAPQVIADFVR